MVARGDGELGRRLGSRLGHETAIHADALGLAIDIASGGLKDIERLVIQEQDADLLENPHACLVDGLHPFGVDRLCRIVEIGCRAPGKLFGKKRLFRACLAAATAAARTLRRVGCDLGHGAPRFEILSRR